MAKEIDWDKIKTIRGTIEGFESINRKDVVIIKNDDGKWKTGVSDILNTLKQNIFLEDISLGDKMEINRMSECKPFTFDIYRLNIKYHGPLNTEYDSEKINKEIKDAFTQDLERRNNKSKGLER